MENQNLLVKRKCLSIGNSYILRTSWVYSPFNKNFLLTILNLQKKFAKNNQPLKIVHDQIGSPTNTFGLANVCWLLLNKINSERSIKRYFIGVIKGK